MIFPDCKFVCAECSYVLTHVGNGVYVHEHYFGGCPDADQQWRIFIDKTGRLKAEKLKPEKRDAE